MCSGHCFARGYQRFDLSAADVVNITERAYFRGKASGDYSGKESRYLRRKEACGGCDVRVLAGIIFVFDSLELCVTMYPVPAWFGKERRHAAKRGEDTYEEISGSGYSDIVYLNQIKAVI